MAKNVSLRTIAVVCALTFTAVTVAGCNTTQRRAVAGGAIGAGAGAVIAGAAGGSVAAGAVIGGAAGAVAGAVTR